MLAIRPCSECDGTSLRQVLDGSPGLWDESTSGGGIQVFDVGIGFGVPGLIGAGASTAYRKGITGQYSEFIPQFGVQNARAPARNSHPSRFGSCSRYRIIRSSVSVNCPSSEPGLTRSARSVLDIGSMSSSDPSSV